MGITLYHLFKYNPDTAAEDALRLSTAPYITATTDTPAATAYEDRVIPGSGGAVERHAFGRAKTFGNAEMASGELVVSNQNGELDYLRDHAFDYRKLEVLWVENRDVPLAQATLLATLIIESAEFSWTKIKFVMRDPMLELDLPAIEETFLGDNNGSLYGYEGDPDTIKGSRKPFVDGIARTVSPPMVNASSLIFIPHFNFDGTPGQVDEVSNVKLNFNGINQDTTLGSAGDFDTLQELADATITAGQYATSKVNGGALRLESINADNVLTCDVKVGGGTDNYTVAECVKRIIKRRPDKDDSDLLLSSFTAMDALISHEFGIYVEGEKSLADCVWELLEGAGGFLVGDEQGRYEIGQLRAPEDLTAARVFEEWEIEVLSEGGLQATSNADPNNGVPVWKTVSRGHKYYRTFSETDIASAVSTADRECALKEFRKAADEDNSVKTKHKGAALLEFTGLIDDIDALASENSRQLLMRSKQRGHWKMRVERTSELLGLGTVIQINTTRFGYGGVKNFVILGYRLPFAEEKVDYFIWG